MIKEILRWIAPHGLVQRRREQLQMSRIGRPNNSEIAAAVAVCRYELWPAILRSSESPFTLVDVGANEGEFTEAAAKLVKLTHAYLFEPQMECQLALGGLVARYRGVRVHQMAVGDRAGHIDLICSRNSRFSSVLPVATDIGRSYSVTDLEVVSKYSVPMVCLDDAVPADFLIDLLKIDVQGFELAVINGGRQTLINTRAILIEVNYSQHYKGGATFDDVYQALRYFGFQLHGISAPYIGPDGPLWADAMFVNQSAATG